jgi:hypothetical protein
MNWFGLGADGFLVALCLYTGVRHTTPPGGSVCLGSHSAAQPWRADMAPLTAYFTQCLFSFYPLNGVVCRSLVGFFFLSLPRLPGICHVRLVPGGA